MVGPVDVKRKGSALVWYLVWYWTLTFDLTHDLDLGCLRSYFEVAVSQELLVWLMWNEKEMSWYDTGLTVWHCPLTTPMTFDLVVSRSESEIAISQEWGGRLTWNKKDVSHQFMTMMLTSVTMVWWADVLDSERGDFRRRRAIDISSYIWNMKDGFLMRIHLETWYWHVWIC